MSIPLRRPVAALSFLALLALAGCETVTGPSGSGSLVTPVAGKPDAAKPGAAGGGRFVGDLALGPDGCQAKGKCQLLAPLAYVDSNGVGWEADKGNWTDGASIPGWAKPIVGGSFDETFLKAAIIHDHYCDRHVRPWRETHWAFFDALNAMNLPPDKARLMYFAVLVGGPKWEKLDPAKACSVGTACQKAAIPGAIEPRSRTIGTGDDRYLVRPASYGDARFQRDMKAAAQRLASSPDLSAEDIEAMARTARPDDYYLKKTAAR
jgi:hypothetical protein